MLSIFRKICLVTLMTVPVSAMAVPRIPKALQRFQIGYSFIMTSATYTEHSYIYDDYGNNNIDTSFSKNSRTKGGFGATLGTYFPIARMGEQSSLNIDLDYMYNLMIWDADMVNLSGYDETQGEYTYSTSYNISAATIQMALPIGISYKTGPEATLDRSSKISLSLGTGVYPSLNLTAFESNAGVKLKLQPYLKAELGIFAGINWKVRALYSFGKIDYIGFNNNLKGDTYAYESSASLISKSCFSISVMVMPFSFGYSKSQWWR